MSAVKNAINALCNYLTGSGFKVERGYKTMKITSKNKQKEAKRLKHLKHPGWNYFFGEVELNGFVVDFNDNSFWGDIHCYKWMRRTYGQKSVKDVKIVTKELVSYSQTIYQYNTVLFIPEDTEK